MKLGALLEHAGLEVEAGASGATGATGADTSVTGFAIDHRKVAPGTVFGAFRGAKFNAEDFIPAAVEAGAVAVIASREATVEGALHIASDEPRQTFAQMAAGFFTPVPETVVAVTGTNGKTSVAEMTRQIWRMCGERAASIGTLGVTTPDGSVSTGLTTPDIVTFLSNMSGLAREGVTHVAYEASSHGLSQYRNEGLRVRAGAFTNLSRDHLDYHGTMEEYFGCKMRLFAEVVESGGHAVIWCGPENGTDESEWTQSAIASAKAGGLNTFTVGDKGENLRLVNREASQLGQILEIEHEGAVRSVKLPLIGAYQAANALVAAGLAIVTGADVNQVFDAISRLQPVRGRLERACITALGAPVYVDYAHTPDALAAAILALRPHIDHDKGGRLITVFGAGGDRDTGKREPMGTVAASYSDALVITDDNPRGEDPAAIRAQIIRGVAKCDMTITERVSSTGEETSHSAPIRAKVAAREVADRREAIAEAVKMAGPNDIVLIAGKGHEEGQIIGSGDDMRVLPFNDVQVARECAAEIAR